MYDQKHVSESEALPDVAAELRGLARVRILAMTQVCRALSLLSGTHLNASVWGGGGTETARHLHNPFHSTSIIITV